MFSGLESPVHWLIVGVIALVVLGPKKLPEVGRSLGSGLRGFRESLAGEERERVAEPEAVEPAPADADPLAAGVVHEPVVVAEPAARD